MGIGHSPVGKEFGMKKLRRFVWYLALRLCLITALSGLCVITFYYAMNAANISVVLKDGMARRAQIIMGVDEDYAGLQKYFQSAYLERDQNLILTNNGGSPYQNYVVRGIDHRLDMTWMWCWPWETTARAEFIETIPRIDGRISADYREAAILQYGQDIVDPPKWQGGRYTVSLIKENGQWVIRSLSLKEAIENE